MIRIVLDDTATGADLFPFTLTRSIADLRLGILTLREKWERLMEEIPVLVSSERERQDGSTGEGKGESDGNRSSFRSDIVLSAAIVPEKPFADILRQHQENRVLPGEYGAAIIRLSNPWDLFLQNDRAIRSDFELITKGRRSMPIPSSNQFVSPENIFIEEGARVAFSSLNAGSGPIYIGRNAEVMEGSLIRGPVALCEGSVVKMGARIYGSTTIGPYSTVGGEIKNSLILGYANKAHDGYLGDSVIGEWCNLGAGTSNSNLKNTASPVKVWHYSSRSYVSAGLKCGLLMGDYSRAAINTSFNTGTVVGVCCNIFGVGIPPKYIPSFTWGQDPGRRYEFEKALRDIENWKRLKNQSLSVKEIQTLKPIFDNR